MTVLSVNLCDPPVDDEIDTDLAVAKLVESFPNAKVSADDRILRSLKIAESVLNPNDSAHLHVLESLKNHARLHGPARSFSIPRQSGECIVGVIKRKTACFIFDDGLDAALKSRFVEFLQSIVPRSVPVAIHD